MNSTKPLDNQLTHIPLMLATACQQGDVLLQLADNSLFGQTARLVGGADAAAKGVPVCQHLLVVTRRGRNRDVLATIESNWTIRERDLDKLDAGRYIVLRHRTGRPDQIAQGITWARTRLTLRYGYENLVRVGLQLLFKIKLWAPDDSQYTICSEFAGDIFEHAGLPLGCHDHDADLKPWDYLCPPVSQHFKVLGQFTVPPTR